jgi:hypothetical protein
MGASSSVNSREFNEFISKYYDEEYKNVDDSNKQSRLFTKEDDDDEDIQSYSSVWFTINAIISSIMVIKSDLHSESSTFIGNEDYTLFADSKETTSPKPENMPLFTITKVLTKIMINIDSIYNIQNTTFEYGKIQSIDKRQLELVKNTLKEYYGKQSLIIINNPKRHPPIDLSRFTYNIFDFIVEENKLYVYV